MILLGLLLCSYLRKNLGEFFRVFFLASWCGGEELHVYRKEAHTDRTLK